jgi:hypothetical protein
MKLDFPWKTIFLTQIFCGFLFQTYLLCRQYRRLELDHSPIYVVIKWQDQFFSGVKREFYCDLYELLFQLCLISFDILPKVWRATDGAFGVPPRWLYFFLLSRNVQGYEALVSLFNTLSLIWTLETIPFSDMILGFFHFLEIDWKAIETRYNKTLVCILSTISNQLQLYIASYLFINSTIGTFDTWRDETSGVTEYSGGFSAAVFVLGQYLFNHLSHLFNTLDQDKITLMAQGNTKSALENLASRLNFRLCSIYIWNIGSEPKVQAHVIIFGPPWRRSLALTSTATEKCSTGEVVALAAQQLGDWRNNPLQRLAMSVLVCIPATLGCSDTNWFLEMDVVWVCFCFSFYQRG